MNTEQLKQAAIAATPGPWLYVRLDEWSHSVCTRHGELPDGSPSYWAVASINKQREPEHEANAAFIAAANPATILALLECVEALRGLLNRYDAYSLPDYEKNVIAEDNARAALQKLEAPTGGEVSA
jgi:hypothetical protein